MLTECRTCNGTGLVDDHNQTTPTQARCQTCNGEGLVIVVQVNAKMKIREAIAVCREAIHTKLYRREDGQHEKWIAFLQKLSALYGVEVPDLEIEPTLVQPKYDKVKKRISINKYSVISLLHEYGHHIGLGEAECKLYSEEVYFGAWPRQKERLVRDERGYLIKKPKPEDVATTQPTGEPTL